VPGYIYASKGRSIYVNLYVSGRVYLQLDDKSPVQLIQQSNYPWGGDIRITVNPKKSSDFSLLLRIPGWARNEAIPGDLYRFRDSAPAVKPLLKVNGLKVEYECQKGYAVIRRTWKKNDRIELVLPMEVRKVVADTGLKEGAGKLALQRGPVIYCAEWVDNNGRTSNLILPDSAAFTARYQPGLLNGIMILQGKTWAVVIDSSGQQVFTREQEMTAIPYYAWANRGKGEMNIWFPASVREVDLIAK
jgi:DUF1680 family protein